MLAEGVTAPPFAVPDHEGTPFDLTSERGHWVLLWWTRQGMGLRDQAQTFAALRCEIIGGSYDSPEDNRLFAEKFDFPFRLLSDPDRSVSAAYGVQRAAVVKR